MTDIFSLENKKVVITGGAGVLCSAIAKGLGEAGAEIALCDIAVPDKVIDILEKNGIKAKGYYIDVTKVEEIEKCYDMVKKDFDTIDVLINGVGGNLREATTSEKLSFLKKLSFLWIHLGALRRFICFSMRVSVIVVVDVRRSREHLTWIPAKAGIHARNQDDAWCRKMTE